VSAGGEARPTGLPEPPRADLLVKRAIDLIEQAPKVPLSSDSRINKEEMLELLNEAFTRLPDELRASRWLLKEREEFLTRREREGDEILQRAQVRAARLVERQQIVREAETRARQIIDEAESESRRMRHEVEDYCDRKLGNFEVVLNRLLKTVDKGRRAMSGVTTEAPERDLVQPAPPVEAVFDQDLG
jgi:hypothetical protein